MEYIRTLSREFDAPGEVELNVENRSGTVTVRGEDARQVRVEVVAHLWGETEEEADDQAELISRGIRQEGDRVTARAPSLLRPHPFLFFSRTPRVDYLITVPRECSATISSRSGRVEIERIRGPLEATVRSGRLVAREIEGDVRITSSSGTTQAEAIGGTLVIESRSGGVRVSNCKSNARVTARSGTVQIEGVRGNAEVQTKSGTASIADVGGSLSVHAVSGSFRYEGPVRAPFDISVVSGSLRLALDQDSVFFLDAETTAGSVNSDLPLRSKSSPPPKDAPTVRLRTRAGSIHIGWR
jgi:DUF4097 and DUF4098 domain-containing protein YvlB